MANYAQLKAAVQSVVKSNGAQEITGANLQTTLINIINSLGANYQFAGVATTSTSPGSPDQNVFYIGGAGTYTNFGSSYTVPVGSIGVFAWNGSWEHNHIQVFANGDIFDGHYNPSDRDSLMANGVYRCTNTQYIMFVKTFASVVHQCEVGFNVSGDNYQYVYRIREYDGLTWGEWKNFDTDISASITSLNQRSFDGYYNNTDRDTLTSDGIYKCTNRQYIMFIRNVGATIYQCEVGFNNMQFVYRIRKNEGGTWSAWVSYDDGLNEAIERGTVVQTENIFDNSLMTAGYIGTGDGLVKTNPSYPNALVSPVIQVEGGATYYLQGRQSNAQGIVGYKADETIVNITGGTHYQIDAANGAFTVPNDVVSVRFTVRLTSGNPDNVMLSKGTSPQSYKPNSIVVSDALKYDIEGIRVSKGVDVVSVYVPTGTIGQYVNFNIRHYDVQADNVDYWRLADSYLVSDNGDGTYSTIFQVLLQNENEYAIKLKNGIDHTGGYHGDEKMTGLYFAIDGNIFDIASLPASIICKSFSYFEKSEMYGDAIGDSDAFANHYKQTSFERCFYKTTNRIEFVKDMTLACVYGGLSCIHKSISDVFVGQDCVLHTTNGNDTQYTIPSIKESPSVTFGSKQPAGCVCASRILGGISPEYLNVVVWDRSSDTKYYNRTSEDGTFQEAAGNSISSECVVTFKM